MAQRRRKHFGKIGYREADPDRKLLSLNDWYGFGVLAGIFQENAPAGVRYACSSATEDQVNSGVYHGTMLNIELDREAEQAEARRKMH